mmetsp:Transcript_64139/g.185943  ORF Transcript_64139/g.185943 Transcript_64139/m.185943 type:complete len:226 (+) Transcript_64139:64-741(+)
MFESVCNCKNRPKLARHVKALPQSRAIAHQRVWAARSSSTFLASKKRCQKRATERMQPNDNNAEPGTSGPRMTVRNAARAMRAMAPQCFGMGTRGCSVPKKNFNKVPGGGGGPCSWPKGRRSFAERTSKYKHMMAPKDVRNTMSCSRANSINHVAQLAHRPARRSKRQASGASPHEANADAADAVRRACSFSLAARLRALLRCSVAVAHRRSSSSMACSRSARFG